jgi:threonine synthase
VKVVSTRGQAPAVSFREAVLAGLAPDGGLYVPSRIDRLPDSWWDAQRDRPFPDLAAALAHELVGDEFTPHALDSLIRDALNFPVPITRLDNRLSVLELFHGPTFAFKDFGARTLARLMLALSERERTKPALSRVEGLTVLVATSGDTGGAVAQAFHNVRGTRVVVLYPEGKVSDVQEAQFTTLGGNVSAVAVHGSFDDCQRLAKDAFADAALRSRVRLTSANSISLGRLLPQIFYYAYAALRAPGAVFSVPSGNFGNLAAGVMAWKLGAPIGRFLAPTTINDTVPRFLASGSLQPRPSVVTLANAMDVGDPSNLERLQWLFEHDLEAMRAMVTSTAFSDDDVRKAIAELDERFHYIADPHTAIAYLGARHERATTFVVGTAHPAKFREVVEPIVRKPVQLPPALASMLTAKKVSVRIEPALEALASLL